MKDIDSTKEFAVLKFITAAMDPREAYAVLIGVQENLRKKDESVFEHHYQLFGKYPWLCQWARTEVLEKRIHFKNIDPDRRSVVDFYIKDFHWPAFNIADSAISVGMAIFLFHLIFKKMPLEN